MVKAVLVNPPLSGEEHYGSVKDLSPNFPLLGISFISAYAQSRGFDVDLLDLGSATHEESAARLKEYDVVGFSAFVTNYRSIIRLAEKIKTPENLIVAGGPHATLFPTDFQDGPIDYVISGDGELPFVEILKAFAGKKPPGPVAGLSARGGDGRLIPNGTAETIDELDLIGPPRLDKYDMDRYHPPVHVLGRKVIHTVLSRGCPYQCAFCAAAEINKRRIRHRGLSSIMDELKSYRDRGYDSVMFYDDIFTLNRKRVHEFCEALVKAELDLHWMCFTRTDRARDLDMLQAMKESGCYLITFGCESANDKTLKLLKKDLTHEDNIRGIEMTAKAGILSFSSFMTGLPGESREDILNTIRFARDSKLTFAVFPIFEPFKGTPIYETCARTGSWRSLEREGNQMLVDQEETWVPDNMTRGEVVALARRAFRDFYFKPKRVLWILKYLSFQMPPKRALGFLRGGLSYFLGGQGGAASQRNTHY